MEPDWTILVISGPVATGKTTVAEKLSIRYKIPYLGLDDVRIAMQQVACRNEYPEFYTLATNFTEIVSNTSTDSLIDAHKKVSKVVWKGLKIIIENHIKNNQKLIIEGDAVLPQLLKTFPKSKVKALFLYDDEVELFNREIARKEASLTEDWYRKFIDWQEALGKQMVRDAKRNKYFIVKTSPINSFYSRVLAAIEPRSWMRID